MDTLEKKLRDTLAKMEIALGSVKDAIVWTDEKGNVEWCNKSFDKLVETEHLFILGQPLIEILPLNPLQKSSSSEAHPLTQLIQSQEKLDGEYELDINANKKTIEFFGIRIYFKKTEPSFVCVLHDITLQKKYEESITQKTEELARSNADLEKFAYIASHDLKQPLRSIMNFIQLIEEMNQDKLDEKSQKFINIIIKSSNTMYQLIDGLLEYSRIDSRGKPLSTVSCEQVMEDVLNSLHQAIVESGAKINRTKLPMVIGDPVQLNSLFQNIISNSIKFCKDKSPEIVVSSQSEGDFWKFEFKDNGIGIKKEYLIKAFEIFQRFESDENFKGTGLGLAICKKIVERQGGKISIDSNPGEGTTITFTLKKIASKSIV